MCHERGDSGHEMLTVVEDQEQGSPGVDHVDDRAGQILTGCFPDIEDVPEGLRDHRRIGERRQIHQPDPAQIARQDLDADPQREPGLANAAGADERHEPRRPQPLRDLGDLSLATDETGQRLDQVMAPSSSPVVPIVRPTDRTGRLHALSWRQYDVARSRLLS